MVSAKVTLKVTTGPIKGEVFSFDAHDTFLFGRHTDCHAQLPKDGYVSRHHFILEVNPPDARIRDLGSLNGTVVNGIKYGGRVPGELPEDATARDYPSCDLADGDSITVGNTTIQVTVDSAPTCCQCGTEIIEDDDIGSADSDRRTLCTECHNSTVAPTIPDTDNVLPHLPGDDPGTAATLPAPEPCEEDATQEVGSDFARGADPDT